MRIVKLDENSKKNVLENMIELGLILFLLGSGIAGGTKFIEYFKVIYFFYGILIIEVLLWEKIIMKYWKLIKMLLMKLLEKHIIH